MLYVICGIVKLARAGIVPIITPSDLGAPGRQRLRLLVF
jgi:hypothetical protein